MTKKKAYRKTAFNPSISEQAEYYRVQEQLIEKDLPNCKGCIHGSAHDKTFTSPLKIYELEGDIVSELKLQNTKFDIPVVWNKQVAMWVKFFTGKGRKYFVNYTQRAGRYAPVLSKIMADNGLPRDLIFLAMAESGFQNHARSWAKAVGPWQFMPYTGKKFGLNIDWYVDERRDPLKASIAAANYLKTLHNLFGSWELAAAGYNAGEGKIARAIRMYHTTDFWKLTNGRYLKPETKNYVPKIMALAIIGKNLEVFGLKDEVKFEKALDYEEIMVKGNADLYEVAEVLELDFEELKRYNPELVRWQIPPYLENYALRVPVGAKDAWDDYKNKDSVVASSYKTFIPHNNSSLEQVSRKFKVPVEVLEELNPDLNDNISARTVVYLPFREDHSLDASMYADIYEKSKPKKGSRSRDYERVVASQKNRGQLIKKPTVFYTVKRGDTLWKVAQMTGVPMSTIIRTNSHIIKRRTILPGDKLAIR